MVTPGNEGQERRQAPAGGLLQGRDGWLERWGWGGDGDEIS